MVWVTNHYEHTALELLNLSSDEVKDLFMTDPAFKERIIVGCQNYSSLWLDEGILHSFQNGKWNSEERDKLERNDPSAISYWFREYADARYKMEQKPSFQKNKEKYQEARQKLLKLCELQVPAEHRGCKLEDFGAEGQKKIINAVMNNGYSFLLCGPRGIGKTRMGWAFWVAIKEEDRRSVEFLKMFELQKMLLAKSTDGAQIVDYINSKFVYGLDVLILDEVDKISMTDASFANFSYLIDRRYEEHKQTILFANGTKKTMEESLGSSMLSRFNSKSYKSKVLELSGSDKRPVLEG